MKANKLLGLLLMAVLVVPMLASAQIYKWKDKNGVTRYSDSPPPVTVKSQKIGKTGVDQSVKPKRPSTNSATPASDEVAPVNDLGESPVDPEVEAKRIRDLRKENERKKAVEDKQQAKIDAENCRSARANYQSYVQGGRIYKVDANGERIYEDDAGLEAGKARANADIRKYCK